MLQSLTGRKEPPKNEQSDESHDFDEMIRYVESLIRWYSARRSIYLANHIVSRLELIRDNAVELDSSFNNWNYDRLIKQWRYLCT